MGMKIEKMPLKHAALQKAIWANWLNENETPRVTIRANEDSIPLEDDQLIYILQ